MMIFDSVLILSLVVIALCMTLGRPLKIDIKHTYHTEQPAMPIPTNITDQQKELDDQQAKTMDAVVSTLNEIMGVNVNGEDR